MTTLQIELVQTSFEAVKPIAEIAADLFYTRLFELDPALRAMFRTDRAEQGRKLMHMIGVAVKGLSRPEQILPAVEELGRRHACYGVRDEHYETVGAALLWTLEMGLGEAFTPDVRAAWAAVYTLLTETMQRAAAGATTQYLAAERATGAMYV